MSVPFGFSAGDIALAIQLLSKVGNALKETGGASSEYHEVLRFLQTSQLILQHLEDINISRLDLSAQNAIRAQARALIKPIQHFAQEIEAYATSLGRPGAKPTKSALQKAKWTLFVTEKVESLRNKLTAEIQLLQLLLQTETLQSINFSSIRLRAVQNDLHKYEASNEQLNAVILRDAIALKSQPQALLGPSRENISASNSYAAHTLADAIKTLRLLLIQLVITFRDIYFCIICLMPRALCHFQSLTSSILRAPSFLFENNIEFEDSLGRKYSLPYEWFSKWPIIRGFIQYSFQGVAGEWFVKKNLYQLYKVVVHNKRPGMRHLGLSPGVKIKMAVVIPATDIMPLESERTFVQANCDKMVRTSRGGHCLDGWTALGFENFESIYLGSRHMFAEGTNRQGRNFEQLAQIHSENDVAVHNALTILEQRQSDCYLALRILRPIDMFLDAGISIKDISPVFTFRNVDLIFFESGC